MKATFTIPVTVERDISCMSCDRSKQFKTRQKKCLGLVSETVYGEHYCDLFNQVLKYPESSDPKDSPCLFQQWQQTNTDFEITEEVFTIHFKDSLKESEKTNGAE